MKSVKSVKGTETVKKAVGLKSIHEELYKDGKSVDEIIKKYPQLKNGLEPARKTIEEQRKAMEQMYASGVIQEMEHYRNELGKIADRLQPALKVLQTVSQSPASKHVQEIGPLKFSVEVTPTVKSVVVSLQDIQSGLKTLKTFRKKDVLFPSLLTPQSLMALDMVETKELTKQILAGQKSEDIAITVGNRPFCVEETGIGYLRLGRQGTKVKIGRAISQPYRLMRSLTEPLGVAKSVETVFEAMRLPRHSKQSGAYSPEMNRGKKFELILNSGIKEVQKVKALQGKLKFGWDELKTKVWLDYIG